MNRAEQQYTGYEESVQIFALDHLIVMMKGDTKADREGLATLGGIGTL